MLLRYDLGDLSLGAVFFGNGTDYLDQLLLWNSASENSWWSFDSRPSNLLMIGGSDGYCILWESTSDSVLTFRRSEAWDQSTVGAASFELFFRAAGTVFLSPSIANPSSFASALAGEIGASRNCQFWSDAVNGLV